jgi:NAD(P)-dependent dehydrogenase (short-subunit alcohol dehydrogenase family)
MSDTAQVLAGQVAVVTGAGRGIGKAIATMFARAGATIVAAARSANEVAATAAGITADGGKATSITVDVTSVESVADFAKQVTDEFGTIQVLVNNAGTHRGFGPIWEVDPVTWWKDIETSMFGPFLLSRAFIPGMLEAKGGRIVNLSSGAATEPRPYSSGYSAAKTGAQRFTESVQRSLAGTGVYMFSLNPGPVMTPMNIANRANETYQKWHPGQRDMTYFPPERAATFALALASGRGDSLAGRFVSTFDEIEDVIAGQDAIKAADLRLLTVQMD